MRLRHGVQPQPPGGTVGLLTVQSTPPTGLSIGSSTGHGGTTSYAMIAVATGTTVNLQVPATDPAGYTFSQWTVNGAAQTAGQKSITFTIRPATTAVAQYTSNPGTAYSCSPRRRPGWASVRARARARRRTTRYRRRIRDEREPARPRRQIRPDTPSRNGR